jgi:4-hydroxy-tetrahydrodipicolinate synthase
MKTQIFRGTGTAIVTPFATHDGSIDFPALHTLVERQIAGGVEAIIPLGSTGEGATLAYEEKLSLIDFILGVAKKKMKVIAGTGTNDTHTTVQLTREAAGLGIDAALIVSPYYNKPTPEGILRHYRMIADTVDIPLIVYNVPGRTGSNLTAETTLRLAEEIPNVVAIKEASGNMEQVMEIIRNKPEGFCVLSGEDSLTLPIIASGGDGVIAVVSNEAPQLFSDMTRNALAGKMDLARTAHYTMFPLMRANFFESNPIPVKAALSMMGLVQDALRLPLMPLSEKFRPVMREALRAANLL